MTNAAARSSVTQDDSRKTFTRLFNLLISYLSNSDPNMNQQGLEAFQMLINSHFVFFLQEKHQFIQIMTLCKPSQMIKELTEKIESSNVLAVSSIEMIRVKVLECIANLCQ